MLYDKASAHVVVCDAHIAEAAGLAHDLPLVRQLPVTVVQCAPPTKAAWHATWANGFCYGIENRNIGRVTRERPGDTWRWWPEDGRAPAPAIVGKAYKPTGANVGYEPYTNAQLRANVIILRYLRAFLKDADLDPRLVLPHAAYQAGKFDTGPLYPTHDIRELVFDDDVTMRDLDAVFPDAYHVAEEHYDEESMLCLVNDPNAARNTHAISDSADSRLFDLPSTDVAVDGDVLMVRSQLATMGFHVPLPEDPSLLDGDMRKALWVFQRGHGLTPTSQPDDKTRARLTAWVTELAS
jgi:hypothetical protein